MVAGNWKMHLNHLEAIAHVQRLAFTFATRELEAVEVVVLPPFTDLRSVQTLVDGDRLLMRYGAQDLSRHPAGAHTGDICGAMLAKLGCSYVVVGHSERRSEHGETDEVVRDKVRAAYDVGVTPILCVGEDEAVRASGGQLRHVEDQLTAACHGLAGERATSLVVAYEPIWAIGTGAVATPADAQEVGAALRARLAALYSPDLAAGVRLLYGGSVKGENAADLLGQPDVDGALVGGASLDAEDFVKIARAVPPRGEQPR